MNKNICQLTLNTIVASIIATASWATPAIGQKNHLVIEERANNTSSTLIVNNKQQKDVFRCELGTDNTYRTMAYTKQGKIVELITWKGTTNQASGYSPQQRCSILAYRFQRFSDAGQLKYVSTGIINKQPVICIASSGGECQSDGLLLTLDPQDDPDKTLKNLFDLDSRLSVADGNMGNNTVDITKLLNNSP